MSGSAAGSRRSHSHEPPALTCRAAATAAVRRSSSRWARRPGDTIRSWNAPHAAATARVLSGTGGAVSSVEVAADGGDGAAGVPDDGEGVVGGDELGQAVDEPGPVGAVLDDLDGHGPGRGVPGGHDHRAVAVDGGLDGEHRPPRQHRARVETGGPPVDERPVDPGFGPDAEVLAGERVGAHDVVVGPEGVEEDVVAEAGVSGPPGGLVVEVHPR